MNEKQIILSCKKGQQKGQKALVYQHTSMLMGLAFRYTYSEELSKDLVQEIFIHVFNKIHKFNEEKGAFKPWLKTVAINKILNELRKEKNLFDKKQEYLEYKKTTENYTLIESTWEENEMYNLLLNLPKKERLIFNLFAIEGYSHKEISEQLDVTESYSRTLLTRGRQKLKSAIMKKRAHKSLTYGR